ncbi:CLD14 protein, partial [Cisticola juncidis]|nr:CLD14 protein [Cisticola juncidis]
MSSWALELLGFSLGLLGLLGTLTATILPHWWRSAHAGSTILTAAAYVRGLWMDCVWHSTGVYHTRAMMVTSCLLAALAAGAAVVGMRCTRCAEGSPTKTSMAGSGGIGFVVAGLLCLAPVSWSTHGVIVDFYDPTVPAGMKFEIGQALYLGFASSALSMAGGGLLWTGGPVVIPSSRPPSVPKGSHAPSLMSVSRSGYRLSDYV